MATFNNITAESFAQENLYGTGRKRQRCREAVSCLRCRQKKVKCDRNQPCNQCRACKAPSRCIYTQIAAVRPPRVGASARSTEKSRATALQSRGSTPVEDLGGRLPGVEPLLSKSPVDTENNREDWNKAPAHKVNVRFINEHDERSKIRLTGETHWRFTCVELPALRQIIEKAPPFTDSRHAFRDIKRQLRVTNALPPPSFIPSLEADFLIGLLPSRTICEHWAACYFEQYGRLFDVIQPRAVARIMETIWSNSFNIQASSISLVLLIIAVAMQNDDDNRLLGRRVAQQLQDFFYSSGLLSKPNLEVFQNLCLLVLLKYIAASDIEKFDGMASILGRTQQMAFAMGLHRDPGLFPTISPYTAGLRRRLWSNFRRLALEYSVQSGTPLTIRTDDADCPLPLNQCWDDGKDDVAPSQAPQDLSIVTDSTFGIVTCMLATLGASIQQAIYAPSPRVSIESCTELRDNTQQILARIPKCLQHGTSNTDWMKKLQQGLINILACRSSLLLSTHLLLTKRVPEPYYRTLLLDIWESSCSILHSMQMISADADIWRMGRHFVWADACRAIFCAAMVLQKLRDLEVLSIIPPHSYNSIVPLQKTLHANLSYMSDLWLQNVPRGPTVAKAFLYIRVLTDLSRIDFGADHNVFSDEDYLAAGVRSANQAVETLRRMTEDNRLSAQRSRRRHHQPISDPPITKLTVSRSEHAEPAIAKMPSSPADGVAMAILNGDLPHLATARRIDSLYTDFDNLQFDPSVAHGNPAQHSQEEYFNSANTGLAFPFAWPWTPGVPVPMQAADTGDSSRFNARAIHQAIPAIGDSIFMALTDGEGKSNTLPVDFDIDWANLD